VVPPKFKHDYVFLTGFYQSPGR